MYKVLALNLEEVDCDFHDCADEDWRRDLANSQSNVLVANEEFRVDDKNETNYSFTGTCEPRTPSDTYWSDFQDRVDVIQEGNLFHKVQRQVKNFEFEAAIFPVGKSSIELIVTKFNTDTFSDFKELHRQTYKCSISNIISTYMDDSGKFFIEVLSTKGLTDSKAKNLIGVIPVEFRAIGKMPVFKAASDKQGILNLGHFEFLKEPKERIINTIRNAIQDVSKQDYISVGLDETCFGGLFAQTFLLTEFAAFPSPSVHGIVGSYTPERANFLDDYPISYVLPGSIGAIEERVGLAHTDRECQQLIRDFNNWEFGELDTNSNERINKFFKLQREDIGSRTFRVTLYPEIYAEKIVNMARSMGPQKVALIASDRGVLTQFQNQMKYWASYPMFKRNTLPDFKEPMIEALQELVKESVYPAKPFDIVKSGDVMSIGVVHPKYWLETVSVDEPLSPDRFNTFHSFNLRENGLDTFLSNVFDAGILPIVFGEGRSRYNSTLSKESFNSFLQRGEGYLYSSFDNVTKNENGKIEGRRLSENLIFEDSGNPKDLKARDTLNKRDSITVESINTYRQYLEEIPNSPPSLFVILRESSHLRNITEKSWLYHSTFGSYAKDKDEE
ncbi:hypothetical protein HOG98_03470 [bacterium]|jgi:hypothetical protein|nr:hypothetical protein [bacterium]